MGAQFGILWCCYAENLHASSARWPLSGESSRRLGSITLGGGGGSRDSQLVLGKIEFTEVQPVANDQNWALRMTSRRNHFVPQCYLKGFARPRKKGKSFYTVVFDRSGKTFTTNILNIANKRDFNRVEIEGQPPDVFEQAMASFEGELGPALGRILEAQSLDNENDRAVLLNAIALFSTRNPRQRETVRTFHENTSHIMMELATATKERWEAQMRKAREAGEMKDLPNVPYDEMRDFVLKKKYKLSLGAEYQIGLEMGSFETVLPYMFKRKWIACIAPKNSNGFVTSDHPTCLYWSDPAMRGKFHGPGHGLAGTELLFPVGKHLARLQANFAIPLKTPRF